jgi:hypothetical protein
MFIFVVSILIVLSLNKSNVSEIEVYKAVKDNMPYSLEYNFDKGFEILDKRDGKIFNSDDSNVYKKMEQLQQDWIKTHLIIKEDKVLILDDEKNVKKEFNVKNSVEIDKIKEFFKIK